MVKRIAAYTCEGNKKDKTLSHCQILKRDKLAEERFAVREWDTRCYSTNNYIWIKKKTL